ncbi:MAG: hypothetical protein ABJN78_01885 [Hyphomicrobiales bacterium]
MPQNTITPQNTSQTAMTVQEFLSWARIGKTKFYKEVNAGRLTLRKVGTRSLVAVGDAQAWFDGLPKVGNSDTAPDADHLSNSQSI